MLAFVLLTFLQVTTSTSSTGYVLGTLGGITCPSGYVLVTDPQECQNVVPGTLTWNGPNKSGQITFGLSMCRQDWFNAKGCFTNKSWYEVRNQPAGAMVFFNTCVGSNQPSHHQPICKLPAPVDCVTDIAATKATCTASCGNVAAVPSTPAANGGTACSDYSCQPNDGSCVGPSNWNCVQNTNMGAHGCGMNANGDLYLKTNSLFGDFRTDPTKSETIYNFDGPFIYGFTSQAQCNLQCAQTPDCDFANFNANAGRYVAGQAAPIAKGSCYMTSKKSTHNNCCGQMGQGSACSGPSAGYTYCEKPAGFTMNPLVPVYTEAPIVPILILGPFSDSTCTTKATVERDIFALQINLGQCQQFYYTAQKKIQKSSCQNGKLVFDYFSDNTCTTKLPSQTETRSNGECFMHNNLYYEQTWPRGLCEDPATYTTPYFSFQSALVYADDACTPSTQISAAVVSRPWGTCMFSPNDVYLYSKFNCVDGSVEEILYTDAACTTVKQKVYFENGVCNNQLGYPKKLTWIPTVCMGSNTVAPPAAPVAESSETSEAKTSSETSIGQLSVVSSLSERSFQENIYSAFALIGLLASIRYMWFSFNKPSHTFNTITNESEI